mgnify:FL=1
MQTGIKAKKTVAGIALLTRKPHQYSSGRRTKAWHYIVAALLVLLYLLPIYVMLNLSFREITDIGSRLALPKKWVTYNYTQVLGGSEIWIGFVNSIIIVMETVAVQIVASALGAYGLVRGGGWISRALGSLNM